MPRERRQLVNFRSSQEQIDRVDARAEAEGLDRSETIRRALEYALRRMPKGWEPPAPATPPVKAATTRGQLGR